MKFKLRTRIVGGLLGSFMFTVVLGAASFYTISRAAVLQTEIYRMTELSDFAERMVEAHHIWRYNLAWAFLYDQPFVGGLNPHTCIFGNWLAGDMPTWVDDAQVFALIDAVFQPHYDLHVQGGVALELRAEGRMEEALALLHDVVLPAGIESTQRISALRMRYIELRDLYTADLANFIAFASMVLIAIILVSLVIFVVISSLITRSILVPVRDIEHAANALSKMDFTVDIKKTEKDEIGDIQDELIAIRDNLKKGIDDMRITHDKDMQ
ncbi:MAG: methyl-accepting chemotaxis protein, partial [Treponema sp.]|nr:methyl-accepting chemotaxis protein [Treponema sp.]